MFIRKYATRRFRASILCLYAANSARLLWKTVRYFKKISKFSKISFFPSCSNLERPSTSSFMFVVVLNRLSSNLVKAFGCRNMIFYRSFLKNGWTSFKISKVVWWNLIRIDNRPSHFSRIFRKVQIFFINSL